MGSLAAPPSIRLNRNKYGYRDRDFQQRRVYTAENSLVATPALYRQFKSLDETTDWINDTVLKSDWWYEHIPDKWLTNPDIFLIGKSSGHYPKNFGSCWFRNDGSIELFLPIRYMWSDHFVLHELCHPLAKKGRSCHGPVFVRRRLEAQELFGLPGSAMLLDFAMRVNGVKR